MAPSDEENLPERVSNEATAHVGGEAHSQARERHMQYEAPEGRLVSIYQHESWTSSLPPPHVLASYEEHFPGYGKLLLDNFLEEGKHRRRLMSRGQMFALLCVLSGLIIGGIVAWQVRV